MLNTHVYGPATVAAPTVLAIHGVTGHGARWRSFADSQLPGVRVLAPDLRGHGRSPWTPPWHLEQHVEDLLSVLQRNGVSASAPAVIVGHSLGGALACRIAAARPELVRGLVLADSAQGMDPDLCLAVADQTLRHFDYTSPDEARHEKSYGAWARVPSAVLDTEIAEHLVRRMSGRWEWNISCAAITALWGELARTPVGPPPGTPTVLLRAARARYVTDEQIAALPADTRIVDVDSDHMVPLEQPEVTGQHTRQMLGL